MDIVLNTPTVDELRAVVTVLDEWQSDDAPNQLHPGDLGWFWRFGADATAAAVRTWSREGRIVVIGLLDEPTLLRLTTAPDARREDGLARRVVADLNAPARGVLVAGRVCVEAPRGSLVQELLAEAGWDADEPWTPLSRDLTRPVPDAGLRIEVAGPEQASVRAAVQLASFAGSTFTDERWHTMAAGMPYADARCLLGYDEHDNAVATVTVWSAGGGKPGLIEPMGVHRDHRGSGYGRAITLAAAGALRELGSSSAVVATPSSNVAAVATYRSAGFTEQPERHDYCREA